MISEHWCLCGPNVFTGYGKYLHHLEQPNVILCEIKIIQNDENFHNNIASQFKFRELSAPYIPLNNKLKW